jgi:hypothetical protein
MAPFRGLPHTTSFTGGADSRTQWFCSSRQAQPERNNSGGALRQLAILNASHIQKSSPKLHNVVRQIVFSNINDLRANGTYF